MKIPYGLLVAAFIAASSSAAMAGKPAGCAIYDRPGWAAACQENTTRSGREQCCSGAVAWKVSCDVFHVDPDNHAAATDLVYRKGKEGKR